MQSTTLTRPASSLWLAAAAILGAAWNAFGISQLADFATQTQNSLMMDGMSAEAAGLYYGLPAWMTVVFAIGSIGGLLGCIALLARRRSAVAIFAVSLAGYVALYAGDYAYGVFDAIPGQMAILTVVVLIAAALLGLAVAAQRRGLLTSGSSQEP